MQLLNIGCGAHFHPAWTNIDRVSSSPEVLACDITKGLPFPIGCFDVVYHSHIIEHLSHQDALILIKECHRVLKVGGTIRVATPDLESMARAYLDRLEDAKQHVPGGKEDHYWMTLELFDQMVRSFPGGEMGRFLRRPDLMNKSFIISRIGQEAKQFWEGNDSTVRRSFRHKMSFQKFSSLARRAWLEILATFVFLGAGKSVRNAFHEGVFRSSGEIHRWLYDHVSMEQLLEAAGFISISVKAADESSIPDFNSYHLDVVNGSVRKPDSLFMEAIKSR